MVLRCVVYGCSNKKDDKKGISIRQIPFYGDTRAEALKWSRKWVSFRSSMQVVMHLSMLSPRGGTPGICGAFDFYCLPHPREFD